MMKLVNQVVGVVAISAAAFSGSASAAVLFSDNFNSYYGGSSPNTQYGTGLPVQAGGSLAGWTKSTGNGSLHAVDRSNGAASPDYAIMFYDGNEMMYTGDGSGIAANVLGMTYTVSYDLAPAAYAGAAQATQAGDYLLFLLNDTVSQFDVVKAYPNTTSLGFQSYSFTYTGTGNGNLYLSIADGINGNNSFGGEVDNLVVSDSTVADQVAVPEPASILLLGLGMLGAASVKNRSKKRPA